MVPSTIPRRMFGVAAKRFAADRRLHGSDRAHDAGIVERVRLNA